MFIFGPFSLLSRHEPAPFYDLYRCLHSHSCQIKQFTPQVQLCIVFFLFLPDADVKRAHSYFQMLTVTVKSLDLILIHRPQCECYGLIWVCAVLPQNRNVTPCGFAVHIWRTVSRNKHFLRPRGGTALHQRIQTLFFRAFYEALWANGNSKLVSKQKLAPWCQAPHLGCEWLIPIDWLHTEGVVTKALKPFTGRAFLLRRTP